MRRRLYAILAFGLLLSIPAVGSGPGGPFIEYQEIVTTEPYPGGGGGGNCFVQTTIRIYNDGTETHTTRIVCQ